jgi:uncharacterized membrane protein
MGLSIVAASYLWQSTANRTARVVVFAVATTTVTLATPLVRAAPSLAWLADPIEAYLRAAGPYSAFPLFPWAGFLFAGALAGELIDAVRMAPARDWMLPAGALVAGAGGVYLGWAASFQPALFPTARFWHDSPTFFFIRLGLVVSTLPAAWLLERLVAGPLLRPMATLGRSSLFVYWIHIEMVYGIIAEPLKRQLPLWSVLVGTLLLCVLLYRLVLIKNRFLERHELRGPARVFAPVLR